MNIWSNAVITTQGLALQAKLTAGTSLQLTKAQSGSGTVATSALASQTAVTSPKQTLSFRTVTYPAVGTASLPVNLTNDGLQTGYTATQIGVFAQDPDAGEILYFIAQAASGTGTEIPSATEMPGFTAEWAFTFAYGQATSVTVTVDPAGAVSRAEVQTMIDNYEVEVNAALAGKADSSHDHSATDITTGILSVAHGGTGRSSVDTTPTASSTKMVTSGGVYTALAGKADSSHVHSAANITSGVLAVARGGTGNSSADSTPTSGSTKMVTSGGIYTALAGKQNTITYGTAAPSGGSSGDIYIQY